MMEVSNLTIWGELSETGEFWKNHRGYLTSEESVWVLEWEDRLNLSYVKLFVELIQAMEAIEGMEPEYRGEYLSQHHMNVISLVNVMLLGLDPHLMIWDKIKPEVREVWEDIENVSLGDLT